MRRAASFNRSCSAGAVLGAHCNMRLAVVIECSFGQTFSRPLETGATTIQVLSAPYSNTLQLSHGLARFGHVRVRVDAGPQRRRRADRRVRATPRVDLAGSCRCVIACALFTCHCCCAPANMRANGVLTMKIFRFNTRLVMHMTTSGMSCILAMLIGMRCGGGAP